MTLSISQPDSTKYVTERLRLCQQIARLVRAKLPIAGQLRKLESLQGGPSNLATEVSQKLEDGQSLASALAGDNSHQSRILAGCIQAGEVANRLDAALNQWSAMQLANLRNQRSLWASLLYPAILVLIAIVAIFLLVDQLVPMYAVMYQQLDHEVPWWLAGVVWAHDHPWILALVLLSCILVPFAVIFGRRQGLDSSGLPRHPVRRKRLFALSTEIAQFLLEAKVPLQQTAQLTCQAAGVEERRAADAAAQIVSEAPNIPSMAPEASLILNELHSNLITNQEATENLQLTARVYEETAEQTANATIRRLPMLIAVSVGITIACAYAGLIYAPWVQLLTEIVDVPNATNM